MSELINNLFEAQERNTDFEQLDSLLQEVCEKKVQPFKEKLSAFECEDICDIVYSVSYLSKKSAFEIGFKTAMRLVLDCTADK